MRDLFISYTHTDNLTFSDAQRGWVANFHKAVEVRLTQLLGRPSDVFYDDAAMARTSVLTPTIEKEVRSAKILISIMSPGYIASDWCNTELELFAEASSQRGGLFVDTHSRVVKAIKLPVDRELQKRSKIDLSDVLGYEFYRQDPASGPLEFDPDADPPSRLEFTKRVSTLAYDICNILKKLGDEGAARDSVASDSGHVVYLAETTSDLADESARLRRTLQQYGHTVLPPAPYPYGRTYAELASADIARAEVSVHVIGSSYGPEREHRSVLELQYDLAGEELLRRPQLKRLVWSPPGIVPDEERQAAFIARLADEATLVVSPFEKLKEAVQAALIVPPAPLHGAARAAPNDERAASKVYLIFDTSDAANVKALDDWLYDHDYDVLHPIFAGSEAEIRQHDERCLVECDAVLLYWGFAPSYWLPQRAIDVQKAFAYGRTAPFAARGVVVGPGLPAQDGASQDRTDKDLFRQRSAIKMEMYGGFDAGALAPFLAAIARSQDTAV